MPRFSVLIPSYNRPEYLPRAVQSVLASDFTDFELVISDDKSPRQVEIIQALIPWARDPRLIFIPQTENLGEARNRSFLMQRATGPYRIILGDDDLLAPHALATLHRTIARHSGYDIYLFGYAIIDEDDRIFETRRALKPIELALDDPGVAKDLLCFDLHPFWFYHPATFCFTASLHHDIVPNHEVGIGDDTIFLFDALLAGKRAWVIPEVLFSYRKFIGPRAYAQSNRSQARLANIISRRHILYALLARGDLPMEMAAFVRSRRFRQRFLYDSVVTDPDVSEATLASLDLTPAHLAELRRYWRAYHRRWFSQYLLLRRVVRFAGYFGWRGLAEVTRVFRQRRSYRRSLSKAMH